MYKHGKMNREKFLKLLSKKLSDEIIEEDRMRLDQIIKDNEEYRLLAVKLDHYFKEKTDIKPNTAKLSRVWEMIELNENDHLSGGFDYSKPTKSPFIYANLLKVAAMLVVLVGASVLGYHLFSNNSTQDFDTLATTEGKTFRMLDDGTKIWLNKNSTLSYNKAFGQHKREIILEGEAYFDVVKNTAIPLFIHAGNVDIEVKGTAFNVNAYKDVKQIQIALVRGLIQVTDRVDQARKILLHPNEKLVFDNSKSSKQPEFLVRSMESGALLNDTKWIADTLIFNKEKLIDLVARMEKKYDLKINVQSEKLKEKRFSGVFTNETINQALEALKLSYPLTYTINNRLVVIKD